MNLERGVELPTEAPLGLEREPLTREWLHATCTCQGMSVCLACQVIGPIAVYARVGRP